MENVKRNKSFKTEEDRECIMFMVWFQNIQKQTEPVVDKALFNEQWMTNEDKYSICLLIKIII